MLRWLTLTLLVTGFYAADHPNDAISLNNFAVAANFLYRCSYFHLESSGL